MLITKPILKTVRVYKLFFTGRASGTSLILLLSGRVYELIYSMQLAALVMFHFAWSFACSEMHTTIVIEVCVSAPSIRLQAVAPRQRYHLWKQFELASHDKSTCYQLY